MSIHDYAKLGTLLKTMSPFFTEEVFCGGNTGHAKFCFTAPSYHYLSVQSKPTFSMSTVFTYGDGAVTVAPPLANVASAWHSINRSVSDSGAVCGPLFSAVAVNPPRALLSHSWGAHTLSFNFSGV